MPQRSEVDAHRRPRRAPRARQRMLAAPAAAELSRCGPRSADGRVRVRLSLPSRLVRMTLFGLDHETRIPSHWWRCVEAEMGEFVFSHLPKTASRVRMELDAERMEVVVGYDASGDRRRTPRSA